MRDYEGLIYGRVDMERNVFIQNIYTEVKLRENFVFLGGSGTVRSVR